MVSYKQKYLEFVQEIETKQIQNQKEHFIESQKEQYTLNLKKSEKDQFFLIPQYFTLKNQILIKLTEITFQLQDFREKETIKEDFKEFAKLKEEEWQKSYPMFKFFSILKYPSGFEIQDIFNLLLTSNILNHIPEENRDKHVRFTLYQPDLLIKELPIFINYVPKEIQKYTFHVIYAINFQFEFEKFNADKYNDLIHCEHKRLKVYSSQDREQSYILKPNDYRERQGEMKYDSEDSYCNDETFDQVFCVDCKKQFPIEILEDITDDNLDNTDLMALTPEIMKDTDKLNEYFGNRTEKYHAIREKKKQELEEKKKQVEKEKKQ